MLAHQRGKGGFRVVALEQRGHFHRLGGLAEFGARCGHLQAAHHVAPDDGKQGYRAGAKMRAKLFLQHLQQIALGQIHLQHWRQRIVPHIRLGAHRHGE